MRYRGARAPKNKRQDACLHESQDKSSDKVRMKSGAGWRFNGLPRTSTSEPLLSQLHSTKTFLSLLMNLRILGWCNYD